MIVSAVSALTNCELSSESRSAAFDAVPVRPPLNVPAVRTLVDGF